MEEISDHLSNVKINESNAKQKLLLDKLQNLECPFTWNTISEALKEHVVSIPSLEKKYQEIEEDEGFFVWNKIILKLVLCYCYFKLNNFTKSLTILKEIEELLCFCSTPEVSNELSSPIKNGIEYVVLGMKAYLKYYSEELQDVEEILGNITDEAQMDDLTKAAVLGIQAAILIKFPPKGSESAVLISKKAILLDKDNPEWHFLLGKSLSVIRRRFQDHLLPDIEEIEALKKASHLGNNANYIIFLAQTYRELAESASFHRMMYIPMFKCSLHEVYKISYNLYKKALEMKPDCCSVNSRCAWAFKRFPPPYKDIELSKNCAEKALRISPENPFVNETAGYVYLKLKDIKNGLKCLKIAGEKGSYSAYLIFISVMSSYDCTFDPLLVLEDMRKKFCTETLQKVDILCQIGTYYHLVKKNFDMAARYWMEAIQMDIHSDIIRNHKYFLHKKSVMNVYTMLLEEALKRRQSSETSEVCSRYDEIIYTCTKYTKEQNLLSWRRK